MGSFINNFHVHGKLEPEVIAALKPLLKSDAYVASSGDRWVSVYPSENQDHDAVAKQLSQTLDTAVLSTGVHDSDFLAYTLFENGELTDTYCSHPDYFDGEIDEDGEEIEMSDEEREGLAGSPELLLRLAAPGVSEADIQSELEAEELFAERKLSNLAQLLGIDPQCATSTMRYLKRKGPPTDARTFTLISYPS